ncbi:sensor histidine kinase [Clostridium sp. UBA1652]|uniref:sensor histidine kinase n=1 Tax=Clostridium sp. UBA1652 TaxID=1946348 RepID=UPI002580338E|nr:HAMP domain-containing sensor histidine kinase [Clostridium sp. UBA1652]
MFNFVKLNYRELIIALIFTITFIYLKTKAIKLEKDNNELRLKVEKLENKIILDENEYKKLNNDNNEFISLVSHEFRTPLTSIMGFTKIIKKKFSRHVIPALEDKKLMESNEKLSYQVELIKGNLEIIISESERLALMIENILDTTKIDFGNELGKCEKLSIETIINKVILSTYSLIGERDIEVVDLIEANIPYVYGDEHKIMQILINLLSNAFKFTNEGEIVISAKRQDKEFIIIEVKDSGIGIPEKYQNLIFNKFKQVESKDGDKPKGTGLGLYITKNLVKQHGGTIGVRNNETKGCCFFFTLPIYKGEELWKQKY